MAEEKNLARAKRTFETFCKTLEEDDWSFQKDEETLIINSGARGEDLQMDFTIIIEQERELILLLSRLPIEVPENKRLDMVVAINTINNCLVHGCFDYGITSGTVVFRLTNSFNESEISTKLCIYMLYCACHTVDTFNDSLLMLAKGNMTLEQFSRKINEMKG